MVKIQAEYIWLDGQDKKRQPGNFDQRAELRSKTKILDFDPQDISNRLHLDVAKIPEWGFDGSSTNQAEGHFSDCGLKPVFVCSDPIRGTPNILVLCEVMNSDGTPHATNTRHRLAQLDKGYAYANILMGFEQEYTLYALSGKPLAWEMTGKDLMSEPTMPAQGRYYTGVGADRIFGRELMERHTKACLDARLEICGTNWEVMPGQAEYQIGPLPPLQACDHAWVARWLIQRIGEDLGIVVSFHPKPMGKDADWNGAGMHTNISTGHMMSGECGWGAIEHAVEQLKFTHKEHIKVYGKDNELRLTGKHETCGIDEFRCGVSDRGASIRIPMNTARNKRGYIEDRRPAANADPYLVATAQIETICGAVGFSA
mgnify:FL=1